MWSGFMTGVLTSGGNELTNETRKGAIMSRHDVVKEVLVSLQKQIISIETGRISLSETDTRQGLINPLFRALGWDFSDFESVRS